jgi:hypothetical protein
VHVRDFVLANKDEIICARGLNEPKLGCFALVWARVTEMKRKAEKEHERVSKNHLWFPCFKRNTLQMT